MCTNFALLLHLELCNKCRIIDQLTLIELGDHEYLKSSEHYRYFLQDRIQTLSLPAYLKKFINYNRTFDVNYEDFYAKDEVD